MSHPNLVHTPEFQQHFWSRFVKQGDCLLWTGSRDKNGYGKIRVLHKLWLVHRLAWTLNHGPIPDGLSVLHKCDNPSCAADSHLFIGDQFANMQDMTHKGRSRNSTGEHNPRAKITDAVAAQIKQQCANGLKLRTIADQFCVSIQCVNHIATGYTWKHLS